MGKYLDTGIDNVGSDFNGVGILDLTTDSDLDRIADYTDLKLTNGIDPDGDSIENNFDASVLGTTG
ncbi:MAG: hypothetical protein KTR32_22015 [Granulosicoccus sp.]|nr:hypothetical protein [Granulosicoccus sp.]